MINEFKYGQTFFLVSFQICKFPIILDDLPMKELW